VDRLLSLLAYKYTYKKWYNSQRYWWRYT